MSAREFFAFLGELGSTLIWLAISLLICVPILIAVVGSVFR